MPDDLLDQFDQGNNAPAVAVSAIGANADNAGKALSLSRKTGAPATVVDADLEGFVKQYQSTQAGEAVRTNPAIASYVQAHPLAAKVSNDDYENLNKVSGSITDFNQPTVFERTLNGLRQGFGTEPLVASAEERKKYPLLGAFIDSNPYLTALAAGFRAPGAVISGAAGFVRGMIGSPLGPVGPQFNTAWMDRFERDLHIIGMGAIIEPGFAPGGPALVKRPGKEPAPQGEAPVAGAVDTRGKLENIAAYYSEFSHDDIKSWNDDQLKAYVLDKTSTTPPRPGVDPAIDQLHIDQQKLDAIKLDQVVQDAQLSKTKERSPEAFAEFVRQHDTGNVSISADRIAELYKSEGKSPEPGDGLFGFVPDIRQQLEQGLASGVEVKIPLADYVAHIDEAVHGKVSDTIRFRDGGLTEEEAQALGETKPEAEQKAPATLAEREQESLYLHPLFTEGKDLNITEAEFKRYSQRIENQHQELLDRTVAAAQREVAKRQKPEWKANEARTRTEVESDLRSRPDIAADRFIRSGELPTGERQEAPKLSRQAVEDLLGKDHNLLALTSEKGISPDELAPLVGYDSGAAMVKDLELLNMARKDLKESPKAYFDRVAKQETEARMFAQHGELPANILAEARDIALSDFHVDMLADEVKILARQAGGEPPMTKAEMKQWVADNFSQQKISSLRDWEPLRRAVEKNGRDAEKALLKGKFEDAFKAKQRQLLAFLGMKEAEAFKKVRAKADKLVERVSQEDAPRTIDPAHVDQTRRMLDRVGIDAGKVLRQDLDSFPQFIADSEGRLAVADFLRDPDFNKKIPDFTVQEYRDLADSLQSLVHVGRDAKKLDSLRGKADLDNTVFDIVKELERFPFIDQPLHKSPWQSVRSTLRYTVGMHQLVEKVLDFTDKYNPNGPLTSFLDRPLRESYNKELELNEKVVKHLKGLRQYVDSSLADRIDNRVIPDPLDKTGFMYMTRANLRQLMLNMGTESGVSKTSQWIAGMKQPKVGPSSVTLGEASIRKLILDNATEKDAKWVQGMWDLFAELKPEADAMQLRDTGVPADTLKASPLMTKSGELKGGYFPVSYSKTRSNIEGDLRAKNPTFDEHYIPATTPQGYTKRRTSYVGAIDLEGLLTASKIRGMVHDIAFREAVRNGSKLINNPEFTMAMRQRWGNEVADLLPGWLKDIANVHNVDDSYANGVVRGLAFLRQNVTSALIAFNPGTVVKHGGTAAAMSTQRVGAGSFLKAAKEIVTNARDVAKQDAKDIPPEFTDALRDVTSPTERGESTRQFIWDSSALMRNRQIKYEDTIRGAYEQASQVGAKQTFENIRQQAMWIGRRPVSFSDSLSAMPTWLAAYNKEFAKLGDHEQAVFVADREVSRAHGSSFIGDKPAVMRQGNTLGGEALRWFTPLYNFWNHNFNTQVETMWLASARLRGMDEPGASVSNIANRTFWTFVIPVIMEEMASPALDEHKQSLGTKMLLALTRHVGSYIIGLRDITNGIAGGYEPSVGLLGTVMKSMTNLGRDINRLGTGKALRKDWMTDLATALGFATGIGGPQVGKTGGFIVDLATGKERPRTLNEYRQGLRTGHSRARSF